VVSCGLSWPCWKRKAPTGRLGASLGHVREGGVERSRWGFRLKGVWESIAPPHSGEHRQAAGAAEEGVSGWPTLPSCYVKLR
jgi:hypothetical protein